MEVRDDQNGVMGTATFDGCIRRMHSAWEVKHQRYLYAWLLFPSKSLMLPSKPVPHGPRCPRTQDGWVH